MKLKILLIPIWEQLPSFTVMACSVLSSEPFTGQEVENTPPGAYRVKGLKNKIHTAVRRNLEEILEVKTFPKMSI